MTVELVGDFADQENVPLPYTYVNASLIDDSVASIDGTGVIEAKQDGYSGLVISRNNITTATAIGVGVPNDNRGQIAFTFGIDAYPDAITIVPDGQRQVS